nr:hypothetical protein [Mycolicibacterium sp. CBMA 213]
MRDDRGMDANPEHLPSSEAFTTFRMPAGLVDMGLVLAVVVLVLHTLWEAATATGSFADVPGVMRGGVAAGVVYLAVRCARAGLKYWRRHGRPGGIGPAIERIDP